MRCAVLPDGRDYTFWGRGVSEGHSDAIRRVPGVADARQYTVPVPAAVESVRRGENPDLATTREKHTRECYVVLKPGADPAAVELVDRGDAQLLRGLRHDRALRLPGGAGPRPRGPAARRLRPAQRRDRRTTPSTSSSSSSALKLDSNPEFTASVLVAYARAVAKLAAEGQTGARSVFDVPPAYLSPRTGAELRRTLL